MNSYILKEYISIFRFLTIIIWSFILLNRGALCHAAPTENNVIYFNGALNYTLTSVDKELKIFCYTGQTKQLSDVWKKVSYRTDTIDATSLQQYTAPTPQLVQIKFREQQDYWSLKGIFNAIFSSKQIYNDVEINPFEQSCLGVVGSTKYSIRLEQIDVDAWKFWRFLFGTLLFFAAQRLSNAVLFYYICGVSVGVCASVLVVIYFVGKLFPKKPFVLGFIVSSWAASYYFFQFLWDNIRLIIDQYFTYVVYYILISALVSFFVCYRYGPVTNKRTKDLIRWSLMIVGYAFVLSSSYLFEATIAYCFCLLVVRNFSFWNVLTRSRRFFNSKAQKHKLLTNDEYYEQGRVETSKALNELRQYCSSPECNQWKTVLKLKNAKKFASFIEGESHVSENEVFNYENEITRQLTDDDDGGDKISDDSDDFGESLHFDED